MRPAWLLAGTIVYLAGCGFTQLDHPLAEPRAEVPRAMLGAWFPDSGGSGWVVLTRPRQGTGRLHLVGAFPESTKPSQEMFVFSTIALVARIRGSYFVSLGGQGRALKVAGSRDHGVRVMREGEETSQWLLFRAGGDSEGLTLDLFQGGYLKSVQDAKLSRPVPRMTRVSEAGNPVVNHLVEAGSKGAAMRSYLEWSLCEQPQDGEKDWGWRNRLVRPRRVAPGERMREGAVAPRGALAGLGIVALATLLPACSPGWRSLRAGDQPELVEPSPPAVPAAAELEARLAGTWQGDEGVHLLLTALEGELSVVALDSEDGGSADVFRGASWKMGDQGLLQLRFVDGVGEGGWRPAAGREHAFLLRYSLEREGTRLVLWALDPERLRAEIAQRRIPGRVTVQAGRTIIEAEPQEMQRLRERLASPEASNLWRHMGTYHRVRPDLPKQD